MEIRYKHKKTNTIVKLWLTDNNWELQQIYFSETWFTLPADVVEKSKEREPYKNNPVSSILNELTKEFLIQDESLLKRIKIIIENNMSKISKDDLRVMDITKINWKKYINLSQIIDLLISMWFMNWDDK